MMSTPAAAYPNCAALAGLAMVSPGTQSVTSVITPAAGQNAAYCQVNVHYVRDINIRVGLPLSPADGGAGGVVGAWNTKIRNIGGGGTVGTPPGVTNATNRGYVGSSTDSGHNNASCAANGHPNCAPGGYGFVLDANNNLIPGAMEDFAWISVIEQVRWAKRLTKLYYGQVQTRNYWDGSSTGGRQGMEMAQKYADQFDGIFAGSPAINLVRFGSGELWVGTVINDMLGTAGLSVAKMNAANAAANAACDALDGVVDGIIEPRRCTYSAQALKCTGGPSDTETCLTQTEADVIDKVWDGPRNARGNRLWGPIPRGTSWTILATGPSGILNQPASIPAGAQAALVMQDPNWDYKTLTIANFPLNFQTADIKTKNVQADNPVLDTAKNHGTKIITYHGGADPLIFPFTSLNYWNRVFAYYGGPANTDDFFRAFWFPGVGHVSGGAAPQPPAMFDIMVNWVENGIAPDYVVGSQNLGGGVTRTRKICKYPNVAVYTGTGSSDDEANWVCQGNNTEPADYVAYVQTAKRFAEAP
jgi:feruloyl esterase